MFTNTFTREGKRAFRVDETVVGDVTTTYVGNAEPASLDTFPHWQIQKIVSTVSGGNTITVGTFPNGDNTYAYKWSDRLSLTYI